MRRLTIVSFLLAASVSNVGCDDKKKTDDTPKPPPSATMSAATQPAAPEAGTETETATADAGTSEDAKKDKHEMANCPSSVTGASVKIKDVPDGVELAITGADDDAAKEIRDRTKKLTEASHAGGAVKHTGTGQGGGVYGRCTVVMRNTQLTTADVDKGVKITVKAKAKTEVDWLRRETRDRDKEAKLPAAEGAGTQRMAHCPSAVEGATTTVKNVKDGVVVTVKGVGDGVKEIRARAKHTAEVAKQGAAAKVAHTGEGKGGGTLGRCPIVVEGATSVDVKEVDGGAELTVKSKDVPGLQKETKARVANFEKKQ